MPYLTPFSSDCRVTSESGREDKIELDLGRWVVTAPTESLDAMRNYASVPDEDYRRALAIDDLHDFGWIFNRPTNSQGWRNPLVIRNRALHGTAGQVLLNRPLFGGSWNLSYGNSASPPPRTVVTTLDLTLNPLRYVRHQSVPRPLPHVDGEWPDVMLLEQHPERNNHGEFSLDGNDNWLPDDGGFKAWANDSRWRRHLEEYVWGVAGAFDDELTRVSSEHGGEVSFSEYFAFRRVETVWEFSASEPTELVQSLAPALRAYGTGDITEREYVLDSKRRVNCLTLFLPLGKDTELRVYAKTNRRVRFEIIQKEINHRELMGLPPLPRRGTRVELPRPWSAIPACLSTLRERAATALNGVLDYLRGRVMVAPSQMSGFSFLIALASVLHDSRLAHTIAALLIHNGKINPRNASQELRDACARLKRAGILIHPTARRVYNVAVQYRHALQMLQTRELGSILATARRRSRSR